MITTQIPIIIDKKATGAYLQLYCMEQSESLYNSSRRPAILLMPGGAYSFTSDREAEPIAIRLNGMGFQVAVLRYSCAPAKFPQALEEVAIALTQMKEHSKEWNIDAEHMLTMGFSAGGHLAASYGIYWNHPILTEKIHHTIQPFAQILCYPVITSGAFAHEESIRNLLQDQYDNEELRTMVSLEKQVHQQVPRTFLWHTYTDPTVSVMNSLAFATALVQKGVLCEFHMYDKGEHGLATASSLTRRNDGAKVQKECESWMELLHIWLTSILYV